MCNEGHNAAIDLHKGISTYKQWGDVELRAVDTPRGFGHGFVKLTDDVKFCNKMDNLYNREFDCGIRLIQ